MIGYCVCSSLGAEAKLKGEYEILTVRLSLWEWQGVEESRCCFSASGRSWAVLTLAGGEGQPDTGQGEYHQQQKKNFRCNWVFSNGRKIAFIQPSKLQTEEETWTQICKNFLLQWNLFNFQPYFKTPSRSSSGTLSSLGGGRGRWTWIIGAFWELRHGPPGGWVALGKHCALNWRT